MKERADKLLVDQGLVESRTRAQALILAGQVLNGDVPVKKAGRAGTRRRGAPGLRGEPLKFVSRGGLKLERALDFFSIDVTGLSALDVGASTGGFTDFLLQRGCTRVAAGAGGHNQLAWKLRQDPRVVCMEGVNARSLTPAMLPFLPQIAVSDVSFISLTLVLPGMVAALAATPSEKGAPLVALVKPQFEVGKGHVGKGGVVRDEALRQGAVEKCRAAVEQLGCRVEGVVESPITGPASSTSSICSTRGPVRFRLRRMKILLTGVAGFIGSHLAARLCDRGDQIVGLDCFDETLYPASLHRLNLATVESRLAQMVTGDLLDGPLVDRLFAEHEFDAVVHLAALAGVRPSLIAPKRYQRTNIEGTLNLLEAARAKKITRFVFASSSSVYGARDASEVPFSERDPAVRPASPYAATKRAGELLCSNYSDLFGIGTTALRFFTVYGPRQRPERAIAKFARHIVRQERVPFYGDGSSARDYTFIDDIVDGVVASLDACRPGVHRVYNLGGSRTTSLAELVAMLESNLGKKALLDRQPDQPGDVPITFADVSRAEAELGYRPQVPITEGVKRICQWLVTDGKPWLEI